MSARQPFVATLGLVAALAAGPAIAAPVGPDAARCATGRGPALLVSVAGLAPLRGQVNVYVFNSARTWLQSGQRIRRINVPARSRTTDVCVALPATGRYAVAVRHDSNNSRSSDWNDGAGFSRNPRLSLVNLRPAFGSAAFNVGAGVTRVPVTMQYRQGVSVRPR